MIEADEQLSELNETPFEKPALDDVRAALRRLDEAPRRAVAATVAYGLSDLTVTERQALEDDWARLASETRRRVLRSLLEASEAMFEMNYREIALLGLDDADRDARAAAIELLWTDETEETMRRLITLAAEDRDAVVRAAALKELGRFILLGEYGDIPDDAAKAAQALALRIHTDRGETLEVRRRALEALSNSSHPDVERLIRAAYTDGNHDLKISALFAMGRTCSKVWREIIMEELDSADNELVFEAVTACGQIQLQESARRIGQLAISEDREIQLAAIWALGEIGGNHAFEILTNLEETVDDEEAAAVIDEALDTAGFGRTFAALGLDLDED
ncbi:MAG: HEAT repeat domain-containing protein [Chloroflexi bacterium]|nr:HEAT repeat domain-containing protein [Chloroflexota bacterium]